MTALKQHLHTSLECLEYKSNRVQHASRGERFYDISNLCLIVFFLYQCSREEYRMMVHIMLLLLKVVVRNTITRCLYIVKYFV
jgi:hypothetical protein